MNRTRQRRFNRDHKLKLSGTVPYEVPVKYELQKSSGEVQEQFKELYSVIERRKVMEK